MSAAHDAAGDAFWRSARRPAAAAARSRFVSRGTLLEAGVVIVGFALLAVVVTWPLVRDFTTIITSDGSGWDPAGYTWDFWFNAEHGLRLWGASEREVLSAPFGTSLAASANATLLLTVGPAWAVAQIAGPVAAYNVTALAGLTLSSASVYLLVRWLGLGPMPATWAGVALMLAPYQLLRVTLHVPLVHLECFPLLILAGLRWLMAPSWRRALWMVLAVALAWITNPYYGLMAVVMVVVIGVVGLMRFARERGPRFAVLRGGEAAALGVALVALPLYALLASGRDAIEESFSRPRESLDLFGARLSDYVVPDAGNAFMDWVVGDADWAAHAAPGGERTVFLGWLAIALAVTGIALVCLRRARVSERVRLAAVTGVPMALVLVWFSLASPTTILGVRVAVPSEAIFDHVPFVRAYGRFGIAVLVVVVMLAAIGLAEIARRRGPTLTWGIGAAAIAATLVLAPPDLPISTARPVTVAGGDPRDAPAWNWLRDDDPERGIVFEYPTGSNAYGPQFESVERYWQYGQTIHGRRILNGGLTPGEVGYDFTRNVLRPEWPGVASQLAGAGVSTVVINPWALGYLGQPPIDPRHPPSGFELAASFADGTAAWHVVAAPTPVAAIFRGAWAGPDAAGRSLRWTVPPTDGAVTVAAWRPATYRLTFTAHTAVPAAGARLQVELPGGRRSVMALTTRHQAFSVVIGVASISGTRPTIQFSAPGSPPGAVLVSAPAVTAVG